MTSFVTSMVTILTITIIALLSHASCSSFVNQYVERKVDLTTQVVHESVYLKIENRGRDSSVYEYLINKELSSHLSSLSAIDSNGNILVVKKQSTDPSSAVQGYHIGLGRSLETGETYEFAMVLSYTGRQTPALISDETQKQRQTIKQGENQFVDFEDNVLFLSQYSTMKQKISLKTWSTTIRSFSLSDEENKDKCTQRGDIIECGIFENIPPLSASLSISIQYLSHASFVSIEKLEREIEISHWGRISVRERYHLSHKGAKHHGSFSRWTHNYLSDKLSLSVSSLSSLSLLLPATAKNIYYQDQFGNISSSSISFSSSPPSTLFSLYSWPPSVSLSLSSSPVLSSLFLDATNNDPTHKILSLSLRYPLYGGSAITFDVGYELSLSQYITQYSNYQSPYPSFFASSPSSSAPPPLASSMYVFQFSLSPHFDVPTPIETLLVKVVLPEGSSDIQVISPKEREREEETTESRHTDLLGRKVVIFSMKNVVYSPVSSVFQIVYRWSSFFLLTEVSLLFTFYLSFFAFLIFSRRFNLLPSSLLKQSGNKSRVEETLADVSGLLEEIKDLSLQMDEIFQRFLKNKPTPPLRQYQEETSNQKKKILILTKNLAEIGQQLFDVDEIVSEKIRKLKVVEEEKLNLTIGLYQAEIELERKILKRAEYEQKKSEYEETLEEVAEDANRLISDLMD